MLKVLTLGAAIALAALSVFGATSAQAQSRPGSIVRTAPAALSGLRMRPGLPFYEIIRRLNGV